MRKILAFIMGICVVLGAQEASSYQLGAFDLKPFVTIEGRFDDNITSVETNEKDDVSSYFILGLEGVYETKTEYLKFKGSLDQEVFFSEDEYNSTSQYLDGSYKKEFSEYDRIFVDNSFTHADRPRSLEDEFGRSAGRYDYYRNLLDLEYEHDFTDQFSASLKFANQIYDPSIDTISGSVLNRPGLQADYKFNSQTIVALFYDYYNYDFDPDGRAEKHSPAVGIRQYFTKQLYTDVKLGGDFIRDTTDKETGRPNYFVGIFNELDETAQAGIIFSKSHDFTYDSSDLFDNWRISLYWNKQLEERLSLGCVAFTGGGKFLRGVNKEKFNGFGLRGGYDINKNLKATLDYMFSRNDSSLAGEDYQKNTVSLGITLKF